MLKLMGWVVLVGGVGALGYVAPTTHMTGIQTLRINDAQRFAAAKPIRWSRPIPRALSVVQMAWLLSLRMSYQKRRVMCSWRRWVMGQWQT